MKTIGLLGGMSWESTAEYYRIINEETQRRLGGVHSARCVVYSLDFAELERAQHAGDWQAATRLVLEGARALERAGAQLLLICSNTMHKVADAVEKAVQVPLLHIADATARAVRRKGLSRVGLLGTRFTMEEDFYRRRLEDVHGIRVLIPNAAERELVHGVIYRELVVGRIRDESREQFLQIIRSLVDRGAEGVVLGCTEIGLLVKQQDAPVPLFDTTEIHALWAVDMALEQG